MKPIYDFTVIRKRLCDQTPRVLDAPGEVARICADPEHYDREHLVALYLDARLQLIGRETVHIGTSDTCVISPREIFRGGLLAGATQLILVHNHPSGDPSPSQDDLTIADQLEQAGKLIGIPMTDFVVVGRAGRYWSRAQGKAGPASTRPPCSCRSPGSSPRPRGSKLTYATLRHARGIHGTTGDA